MWTPKKVERILEYIDPAETGTCSTFYSCICKHDEQLTNLKHFPSDSYAVFMTTNVAELGSLMASIGPQAKDSNYCQIHMISGSIPNIQTSKDTQGIQHNSTSFIAFTNAMSLLPHYHHICKCNDVFTLFNC
jgi:chloramphenicol O-acetyltransferase